MNIKYIKNGNSVIIVDDNCNTIEENNLTNIEEVLEQENLVENINNNLEKVKQELQINIEKYPFFMKRIFKLFLGFLISIIILISLLVYFNLIGVLTGSLLFIGSNLIYGLSSALLNKKHNNMIKKLQIEEAFLEKELKREENSLNDCRLKGKKVSDLISTYSIDNDNIINYNKNRLFVIISLINEIVKNNLYFDMKCQKKLQERECYITDDDIQFIKNKNMVLARK